MLKEDFIEKMTQTLVSCSSHYKRLIYAYDLLLPSFPLNEESYNELSDSQVSLCDQMIYRFTKLQDAMGSRLFRLILSGLEEPNENMPFIDILLKLEKLGIMESHEQWLFLREVRNIVTHEYPFNKEELIAGLNQLIENVPVISSIWINQYDYIQHRFGISQIPS